MKDYLLAIIGVTGAVFGFVQFLINRKDKNIEDRLNGISMSQYRTEMLVLMNHYENDTREILRLAEHYFKAGGDFYMTSIFAKYLKDHELEKPLWFNEDK